jgi:hypothetical protein
MLLPMTFFEIGKHCLPDGMCLVADSEDTIYNGEVSVSLITIDNFVVIIPHHHRHCRQQILQPSPPFTCQDVTVNSVEGQSYSITFKLSQRLIFPLVRLHCHTKLVLLSRFRRLLFLRTDSFLLISIQNGYVKFLKLLDHNNSSKYNKNKFM